jgi:hypothetical protein
MGFVKYYVPLLLDFSSNWLPGLGTTADKYATDSWYEKGVSR